MNDQDIGAVVATSDDGQAAAMGAAPAEGSLGTRDYGPGITLLNSFAYQISLFWVVICSTTLPSDARKQGGNWP